MLPPVCLWMSMAMTKIFISSTPVRSAIPRKQTSGMMPRFCS